MTGLEGPPFVSWRLFIGLLELACPKAGVEVKLLDKPSIVQFPVLGRVGKLNLGNGQHTSCLRPDQSLTSKRLRKAGTSL